MIAWVKKERRTEGNVEMEKKHQNNLATREELEIAKKKKSFENRFKQTMSKTLFGDCVCVDQDLVSALTTVCQCS